MKNIGVILFIVSKVLIANGFNKPGNKIIDSSLFFVRNSTDESNVTFYSKYNITNKVPKLYKYIDPLEIYPSILENKHLYNHSKTILAFDCHRKLSQYITIIALVNHYRYYLNFGYRISCEFRDEYHDGTMCGDILYLLDLLKMRVKSLTNERNFKMKECLKLEFDVISIDYRFFENKKYVGRRGKPFEKFEIVLVEESFLRKLISEHERLLMRKLVFFELYCISGLENKTENSIDCKLLEVEGYVLKEILASISKRHLNNRLDLRDLSSSFDLI